MGFGMDDLTSDMHACACVGPEDGKLLCHCQEVVVTKLMDFSRMSVKDFKRLREKADARIAEIYESAHTNAMESRLRDADMAEREQMFEATRPLPELSDQENLKRRLLWNKNQRAVGRPDKVVTITR